MNAVLISGIVLIFLGLAGAAIVEIKLMSDRKEMNRLLKKKYHLK